MWSEKDQKLDWIGTDSNQTIGHGLTGFESIGYQFSNISMMFRTAQDWF